MASPPFSIAETSPGDTDVVSQFPAAERTFRDVVESWLTLLSDPATGLIKSFPAATVIAAFEQTAAPTGWTKLTNHNNAALRVVSGSVVHGGTDDFTTVFAARTILQANLPNVSLSSASLSCSTSLSNATQQTRALTVDDDGGGQFSSGSTNYLTEDGIDWSSVTIAASSSISGTVPLGGSGTAMGFAVKYRDVIRATKD